MPTPITRLVEDGDGQAVQIPAEFRLDTDIANISRNEEGELVIHPCPASRGAALVHALQSLGELGDAFSFIRPTGDPDNTC